MPIAYAEIHTKLTQPSNITAFVNKTEFFYTEMKTALEETLNCYPLPDDSRNKMMDDLIDAKNSTSFRDALSRINSFINSNKPQIHEQAWYIDRITAAGYPNLGDGYCYGIGNMAAQAFLTEDIGSFNQRLQWINTIPLTDFRRVPNTSAGVPFHGIITRKNGP